MHRYQISSKLVLHIQRVGAHVLIRVPKHDNATANTEVSLVLNEMQSCSCWRSTRSERGYLSPCSCPVAGQVNETSLGSAALQGLTENQPEDSTLIVHRNEYNHRTQPCPDVLYVAISFTWRKGSNKVDAVALLVFKVLHRSLQRTTQHNI